MKPKPITYLGHERKLLRGKDGVEDPSDNHPQYNQYGSMMKITQLLKRDNLHHSLHRMNQSEVPPMKKLKKHALCFTPTVQHKSETGKRQQDHGGQIKNYPSKRRTANMHGRRMS